MAECTGLENQRGETHRGFKSRRLRQWKCRWCLFYFRCYRLFLSQVLPIVFMCNTLGKNSPGLAWIPGKEKSPRHNTRGAER